MSLRGALATKQSRGLFLLLFFWMAYWFLPTRLLRPLGPRKDIKESTLIVFGPLTLPEKFLLEYPLDINQLSKEDWESLPHVGEAMAQRIVLHRRQQGPFKNLESLREVKGIGPKTIERLRQFFDTRTQQKFLNLRNKN